MRALLQSVPSRPAPLLLPSPDVNAVCDNKDITAEVFGAWMLPQRWVPVQSQAQQLVATCASLLEFARAHGAGRPYVLKGSHSTCGYTYRPIAVDASGECAALSATVRELVDVQHQHCIGVQPFSPHLRRREYRFWLVAFPHERPSSYDIATAVETRPALQPGELMSSSSFDGATEAGHACIQLVRTLLQAQGARVRDFWATLLRLRIPAIRFDCFYDPQQQRAFLNELAPAPDAVLFTRTHESQLARIIGREIAKQWFDACDAAADSASSS